MTPQTAYSDLIRRVKEAALLGSCSSILGWDERTYMPHKGSDHRAEQIALLARMTHEMVTDAKIGELLAAVEKTDVVREADSVAAVNVREIRRTYDRAVKLPKELVEEIARVTTRAQQVWQDARKANDFATFKPWLEKIVGLKRKEADAIGFKVLPTTRCWTSTNRAPRRPRSRRRSPGCEKSWCRWCRRSPAPRRSRGRTS